MANRRRGIGGAAAAACLALAAPALRGAEGTLEDRVSTLEELMAKQGGFRSLKGDWFALGGELEYEWRDAESDGQAEQVENSHGHFDIDKVVLVPLVTVTDDISMTGELTYAESSTIVDEWAFDWKNLPAGMVWRLGYFERFTKEKDFSTLYSYETEQIPMIHKAWTEDDMQQMQLGGRHGTGVPHLDSVAWIASYGSGLNTNTDTGVGEDGGIELMHDDDRSSVDVNEHKREIGLGLNAVFSAEAANYTGEVTGWTFDSNLDLGEKTYVSGRTGYSALDRTFVSGFPTTTDDTQTRTGFRTSHRFKKLGRGDLLFTYERASAEDGELERDGDLVQVSYGIPVEGGLWNGYFTRITPVVKVESYDVDIPRAFGDDDTWDHDQGVLAALLSITNGTTLKIEHYAIESKTGGAGTAAQPGEIDHDEVLVQLEVKF